MKKKIIDINNIENLVNSLKKKNKRIVHCHGVFDLLHIGHFNHFKSAKGYGDVLIVSITPDRYVQKGFNRPYFNADERLQGLANIEVVDFVILNNAPDAVNIIKKIKPDYYCKGKEYKKFKDDITGQIKKEHGAVKSIKGKLVYTDDPNYSSSKILNNSANTYDEKQKSFIEKVRSTTNINILNKKIDELKKLKVLIVGETIIDKYVFCEALGKSGKEPHLVLRDLNEETYLGGVIAIARNISDFSGKVTVLSMLGKDGEYEKLIKKNLAKNIKTKFLYRDNCPTIVKKRYIEHISNNKVLGVYSMNDKLLSQKEEKKFEKILSQEIKKHDCVIVSDYGHGLITKKIAKILCKKSKFISLNAQSNASNIGYHSIQKYKNIDCVVMNENELRHELRNKSDNTNLLIKQLSQINNIENLIITKGLEGAILYNSKKNKFYTCPAFASHVVDKVGAGDTMLSIISLLLHKKFESTVSLFLSSIAAAFTVEEISNKVPISKIKLLKYLKHITK